MATAVNGLPPGFEIDEAPAKGIGGSALPGEGAGPGRQVAGSRVDPRQAIRAPEQAPTQVPRAPVAAQPRPVQTAQAAPIAAPGGLPPGFELDQPAMPAAQPRDVGMGEGIARIVGQSAIPVARTLGLATASLANLVGGRDAAEAVFRKTDEVVNNMRREYEFRPDEQVGLPTQVAGGIVSTPIELVGGFGAQHGIERAADVLQRGGSGAEAATAGGVSGATRVGLNLLPVKAGGAAGRAVENVLAKGIGRKLAPAAAGAVTGGGIAAAGDVAGTAAENAALPEGEPFQDLRQESSPGIAAGLGAAFGGHAGRGSRAARAARAEATPPDQPSMDAETLRLAQKAQDYGIPLRPDMLSSNRIAKYVGDVLEKVPLGGSKAAERQKAFNRAVMDQLGAEKTAEALTPDVYDEALTRAGKEIGSIYDKTPLPVESFGDLNTVARRELPAVQQVVKGYADDLAAMVGEDGRISGDKLRKLRTDAAAQARSTSDGDLRNTLGKLVDRLDDALEKHADAGDMDALRDARRRYAVAKTLEPLVAKSPDGDISPAALLGRVTADKAGKARMARGRGGELGDLARIGQKFLKEPPSSGTAERLAAGGAVAGVGTGALLAPGAAATAAGAIGAANLYNRLGPKLVARRLAKQAGEGTPEAAKPAERAPAVASGAPEAGAPPDSRLAEIARLREGASPETLKALDEHEKAVQREIKQARAIQQRDAEVMNLEKAAARTDDAGIKAALIERANKLRGETIPVGEAEELTSIPVETTKHGRIPTGNAIELTSAPGPVVKEPSRPLPVGSAREVTVIDQAPAEPVEPTQIPTGEAVELAPEQVEPATRPAEAPRSAAGSDTEAELTMMQPGAPALGQRRQPVGDMKQGAKVPTNPFKAPAELENNLRAKLGHKLVDGLQKRNVISLGAAPADVPRDAQGRFTGSTVELYHDRLDADSAPGVLMHEVGMHYGMAKMLGEDRFAELLADVAKMRQRPEVAKAWADVKRNYPDLTEGDKHFVSEVAAHLVESAPGQPIVRRIIDAPRAYLYRQFGVNVGKTDPGLLRALAVGALRKSADVEAVNPNVATAAAAATQREEEAATQ